MPDGRRSLTATSDRHAPTPAQLPELGVEVGGGEVGGGEVGGGEVGGGEVGGGGAEPPLLSAFLIATWNWLFTAQME